jgi:hypothetical protein
MIFGLLPGTLADVLTRPGRTAAQLHRCACGLCEAVDQITIRDACTSWQATADTTSRWHEATARSQAIDYCCFSLRILSSATSLGEVRPAKNSWAFSTNCRQATTRYP